MTAIVVTTLAAAAFVTATLAGYLAMRLRSITRVLHEGTRKSCIFHAAAVPLICSDVDGHILEFNVAAEALFGVSAGEVLRRHLDEAILAPEGRAAWAAMRTGAGAHATIDSVGQRGDGRRFPIELISTLHTVEGRPLRTLCVTDLSERRQTEARLRAALDSAEDAARGRTELIAAMSHEVRTPLSGVVGVVDLLTDAGLPPAQLDLLRMLRGSANKLFNVVNNLLDYSRIEAGLTELNPVRFNVGTLIEDALDTVADRASRKGLCVGYTIDPDVSDVVADDVRVRQVLINLVSNAVTFTDAGEIAVRASAEQQPDGRVAVVVRVQDSGIGIAADLQPRLFDRFRAPDAPPTRQQRGSGLGLSISQGLSRLLGGSLAVQSEVGRGSTFTFRFVATPAPAVEDVALRASLEGLRVVTGFTPGILADQIHAQLARWDVRHGRDADGGHLSPVERELPDAVLVDAGALDAIARSRSPIERPPTILISTAHPTIHPRATADIMLRTPVRAVALGEALLAAAGRPAAVRQAAAARAASNALPSNDIAVLVVEDDDANRHITRLMLGEFGVNVDEAVSGEEAVERARARQYDLILMDVQLPGCDGLEATQQIRAQQGTHSPVIFALTAHVMDGDEALCRQAGMDGRLSKPLRLSTLSSVLLRCARP